MSSWRSPSSTEENLNEDDHCEQDLNFLRLLTGDIAGSEHEERDETFYSHWFGIAELIDDSHFPAK